MASQVTQVQGNDESTAVTQYEEKYEEVMVYLFGFVSGVLVMSLVRFVANYIFGGRYAEPPVICVVDDLNSWLLQPEENWEMWVHRAQHAHVDKVKRRGSRRC